MTYLRRSSFLSLFVLLLLNLSCTSRDLPTVTMLPRTAAWDPFLDTLQAHTIRFFLETTDSTTGMALDRYPTSSPASVASIGFALTAYPIAAERGITTRAQAARRVYNTLRHLYNLPQGERPQGIAGYRGLFYHWLRLSDNVREWNCELSSIDTGLLMAGVLFCQSYFDRNESGEAAIRALADSLYRRADWAWMAEGRPGIALAWYPDRGLSKEVWYGYNESMIMYILAFGSPTYPAPATGWDYWTSTYVWTTYYGLPFVSFGPLFGHQYSHCWIDFRGIRDTYMRGRGIDYFENSRRATYSHRAYGHDNPQGWRDYADSIWGLTACDGPGDTTLMIDGRQRKFTSYSARGVSADWSFDDGTIAPTAAVSSVVFAPEICIPAAKAIRQKYGDRLFRDYGFADAFNPTFVTSRTPDGWTDKDYVGIDQGPIVIMIENLRNELVWKTMKKNPYIVQGLKRAGFTGGWLE